MPESVLDQEFVRNLSIPPRPEVVSVLQEEMRREAPNFERITKCISADVGLAAAMLKVANSPALGLRTKATSVAKAISLLGLRNVAGIATGLVIRHSMGGGQAAALERFWHTAENVALICAQLAQRLRGIPADEAYTFGLFHDCGIPILMRHHANYTETLSRANRTGDRKFTEVEDEAIGANHCAVGYFLARSWHLPTALCQAILRHHDTEVFQDPHVDETVCNFVAIGHIAEHIQHTMMRSTVDLEWVKFEEAVLRHFALTNEDFINFVDEVHESIGGE